MLRGTMPRSWFCAAIAVILPNALQSASASTQIRALQPGDGDFARDRLVPGGTGGFYGFTASGHGHDSAYGHGTIFHLAPPVSSGAPWQFTVLYQFTRPTGIYPAGAVRGAGKEALLFEKGRKNFLRPWRKRHGGPMRL